MPRYISVCLTALLVLSCTQGQPVDSPLLNGTVTGTVSSSMGGTLSGVVVVITPEGNSPLAPDTTSSNGTFTASIRVKTNTAGGTIAVSNVPANCVAPSPTSYSGLYAGGTVDVTVVVSCQTQSGQLIGTVTSSQGGGVANVTVTATPTGSTNALPAVRTGSSGTYTIGNMPLGTGTVIFSTVPNSCQTPTSVNYTVPTEAATDTINLTLTCGAAGTTGVISGSLNNSLGGTLAGVKVVVTPNGGTALPAITSSSAGTFTVTGVPVANGTGTITLTGLPTGCSATPFGYTGLTAGTTLTDPIQVQCTAPTGTLTGTITASSAGGPLANVSVVVTPDKGSPLPAVMTNALGVYTVPNVTVSDGGGAITLANLPSNCTNFTTPQAYTGLTATKPDTANLTVTCVPAVGTVRGTIISSLTSTPLDSITVSVTPTGGSATAPIMDSLDGVFVVPSVPVGSAGTGTLSFGNLPINCSAPTTAPAYTALTNAGTVTLNVVIPCSATGGLTVIVNSPTSSGAVTVTGPAGSGYSQTVTATTTIGNLVPGTYTVSAQPIESSDPTVATVYNVARIDPTSVPVTVYHTSIDTVFYATQPGTGGLWVAGDNSQNLVEFSGTQLRAGGSVTPTSIISVGSAATPVSNPVGGLALDQNGTLWVAGTANVQLAGYASAQQVGGFVNPTYSLTLGSGGNAATPSGIAFDPTGNLWVADEAHGTIFELTASQLTAGGNPTPTTTLTAGSGGSPGGSIAFDASGDLWVSTGFNPTVSEFTPSQLAAGGNQSPAVTITLPTDGFMPLAFDGSGDLWVGTGAGYLYELTPSQLVTGTPTPAVTLALNGDTFTGMAFDLGGNLWVSNAGTGVMEFTPAQLSAGGSPSPATTVSAGSLNGSFALLFNPPPTAVPLPQQHAVPAPLRSRATTAPRRR